MTGVAHAFFWPPCESIISNVSSPSDRVKNISKFTGFFVAGFMIGPLAGTILLENVEVTFRILFQLASYVLAAAIVSSILVSRKRTTTSKSKFTFFSIKEMARFPEIIIMLIFCTASFGMILTIFPAFLNDKSISGTEIELLFFIFGISRLATLAMAGKLSRRTSETLIVATLTIALGLVISYVSDSIIEFAVALILMGFGFSIFFPFTLDIILSKTRKDISGSVIGAYETTFGIGWAIGPITAGFVSEFFGNSAPYLLFFVLGIGVTILSVARKKILEPKKN